MNLLKSGLLISAVAIAVTPMLASAATIGVPALVAAGQHNGFVNDGTLASDIATNSDAAFNTITTVSSGATTPLARSVSIVGTLTATPASGDYSNENALLFYGPTLNTGGAAGIAIGSTAATFTSQAINTRLYAPGGVTPSLQVEYVNTYTDVPGAVADSTSSLTYTFDDTYGAANYTEFSGNLTGAPTFKRLNSATAFSTTATAVAYSVQKFTVSITGTYIIGGASDFDSFFNLYGGSFTPNSLTGGLAVADESGAVLLSPSFDAPVVEEGSGNTVALSRSLTAGTQYFLVTTLYSNSTSLQGGDFTNFISGPGIPTLLAVPEPTTLASLIAGGLLLRRRR